MSIIMSKLLKVLSIIVLIFGLIGAFILGSAYKDAAFAIGVFIGAFFSSFVLFAILYALGEILDRLDRMEAVNDKPCTVENVKLNVENQYLPNNLWKCSHCGTVNDNSVKVCWCGQKK